MKAKRRRQTHEVVHDRKGNTDTEKDDRRNKHVACRFGHLFRSDHDRPKHHQQHKKDALYNALFEGAGVEKRQANEECRRAEVAHHHEGTTLVTCFGLVALRGMT